MITKKAINLILILQVALFLPLTLVSFYDGWADRQILKELKVARQERQDIIKSLTVYSESDSMVGYMVSEANRLGVDPDLANRIIWCESRWNSEAKNDGGKKGQGLFQIIPSSWKYATEKVGLPAFSNPYNYKLNIRVGMWLLASEGTRHWEAWSGWCWDK